MSDVPSLLLQTLGSLTAIAVVVFAARKMRLGTPPTLVTDDDVRAAALEVEDGFEVKRMSIAQGGSAALARDQSGRIMLIKRHGGRFAGRVLTSAARVREEVDALVVDCGDAHFANQRLSLSDPQYWANAINRL